MHNVYMMQTISPMGCDHHVKFAEESLMEELPLDKQSMWNEIFYVYNQFGSISNQPIVKRLFDM